MRNVWDTLQGWNGLLSELCNTKELKRDGMMAPSVLTKEGDGMAVFAAG